MTDSGEDGLSFWANTAQGSGVVRFRKADSPAFIKNFNADFGGQIRQQFTVGISSSVEDYTFSKETLLNVYPNPTSGNVFIDVDFPDRRGGEVILMNSMGQELNRKTLDNVVAESLEMDLTGYPTGVYMVILKCNKEVLVKKFVKG
jgi:hypothetical protein